MRKQLLVLPQHAVADLIRGTLRIEWPEGWLPLRMDWSMPREALMIAVEADEFPEVEPGIEPPTIWAAGTTVVEDGVRVLSFQRSPLD